MYDCNKHSRTPKKATYSTGFGAGKAFILEI
jgi:hypothetical protein